MTITFYILLGYLNITKQRKIFDQKLLETKLNVFFGIYSTLWLCVLIGMMFTYFVFIPVFIMMTIIFLWLIIEIITNRAILVFGKNKDILQMEFMSVNKESVKQAVLDAKRNKHDK